MFEYQRSMNQLHRFQIDGLGSEVHAVKLQIAFACVPPADFIQVEWIHIQSHDSPCDVADDVVQSVSTGYSKHRNGRRVTACQSLRE